MRDFPLGPHLGPDGIDRYVQGALDPAGDAADADLAAHVAACPRCAAEVDEARQVMAALALASAPPADLLARVRARRAAGERVLLPDTDAGAWAAEHPDDAALDRYVDGLADADEAPAIAAHLDGCATCRATVEAARQVEATLALTAAPPADLLARITARRAAGERVLLPGVDAPVAAADADPRHPTTTVAPLRAPVRSRAAWRRWPVGAAGVAAAAALTLMLYGPAPGPEVVGARPPVPGAEVPGAEVPGAEVPGAEVPGGPATAPTPAPGGNAPAASAPTAPPAPLPPPAAARRAAPRRATADRDRVRSAAVPDRPSADSTTPSAAGVVGAPVALVRATEAGLTVVLAGGGDALTSPQQQAVDSAARALAAGPALRATLRYVDAAFDRRSASWQLAERVRDALVVAGVDLGRVTLVRVRALDAELAGREDGVVLIVPPR